MRRYCARYIGLHVLETWPRRRGESCVYMENQKRSVRFRTSRTYLQRGSENSLIKEEYAFLPLITQNFLYFVLQVAALSMPLDQHMSVQELPLHVKTITLLVVRNAEG